MHFKPSIFFLIALFSISATAEDFSDDLDSSSTYAPKESSKTEFIEHPLEAKGLIKITSDKTYIYNVEHSGQTRSTSLRFAPYEPTNLSNPETGASFKNNYNTSSFPMILVDYEWQLWRTKVGRFGFKLGSGLYTANGHGQFKTAQSDPDQSTPLESFTLFVLPNSAGVSYRFQLSDRPWLVPYVEGGGLLFAFSEIRDDGKAPKFGGSLGAYGVGGAALNLRFLDTKSAFALDREYGISSVYLTGEARVIASTTKYDFSATTFAVGFLFDF